MNYIDIKDNFKEKDIVHKGDYISIYKVELPKRKTPIYYILSNSYLEEPIAEIKWYGPWRKYCFFPNSDTLYDYKCMNEINEFLISLNCNVKNITEYKLNTGIYIRVGRENKLLELMNEKERVEWLQGLDKDGYIRVINSLCELSKCLGATDE